MPRGSDTTAVCYCVDRLIDAFQVDRSVGRRDLDLEQVTMVARARGITAVALPTSRLSAPSIPLPLGDRERIVGYRDDLPPAAAAWIVAREYSQFAGKGKRVTQGDELVAYVMVGLSGERDDELAAISPEWAAESLPKLRRLVAEVRCELLDRTNAARAFSRGAEARACGEYDEALRWFRNSRTVAARLNRRRCVARALLASCDVYRRKGHLDAAREAAETALSEADAAPSGEYRGRAMHDLFTIAAMGERWPEATTWAERAANAYGSNHPRLTLLAHDAAAVWVAQRNFGRALEVFEILLPRYDREDHRAIAHALIAVCAGGMRQVDRYRHAALAARKALLAGYGSIFTSVILLRLAEGAEHLGMWAEARSVGRDALRLAADREETSVASDARRLLARVTRPQKEAALTQPDPVVDRVSRRLVQLLVAA